MYCGFCNRNVDLLHDSKTCYVPLNFNHPVKEIVWVVKNNENIGLQVNNALLQLNNQDRFEFK